MAKNQFDKEKFNKLNFSFIFGLKHNENLKSFFKDSLKKFKTKQQNLYLNDGFAVTNC